VDGQTDGQREGASCAGVLVKCPATCPQDSCLPRCLVTPWGSALPGWGNPQAMSLGPPGAVPGLAGSLAAPRGLAPARFVALAPGEGSLGASVWVSGHGRCSDIPGRLGGPGGDAACRCRAGGPRWGSHFLTGLQLWVCSQNSREGWGVPVVTLPVDSVLGVRAGGPASW